MTKSLLAILTAALGLTMSAFSAKANLGDTYAQSCLRYGGPGTPDQYHGVVWTMSKHIVVESFAKNECVRITYAPLDGSGLAYTVEDVKTKILPREHGYTQTWERFDGGDAFVACWHTTDGLLNAALYYNGSMQIAYQWWLDAKGLIVAPTHIITAGRGQSDCLQSLLTLTTGEGLRLTLAPCFSK
jgi:hypothetical protein